LHNLSRVISEELFKAFSRLGNPPGRVAEAAKELNMEPLYASRFVELLGREEAEELLSTRSIHRTIRVNTLKTSRRTVITRLEEEGFHVEPYTPTPYGVVVVEAPYSPGASKEYLKGMYTIQGPASMQAVLALQPADAPVLDLCSGAGVKATQIAQHTGKPILSIDISRRKLLALRNNASRLGATNIIAVRGDATRISLGREFRYILLDAPCTGEGLLPLPKGRRRRRRLEDLVERAILQAMLLENAIKHLAPGGVLVYATCSTAVEENEYVVSKVLEGRDDIHLERPPLDIGSPGVTEYLGLPISQDAKNCTRLYPHRHMTEGFTICRLRRSA